MYEAKCTFKSFSIGNHSGVKILNPNYDFNERGRRKLFDKMICPFTKTATGRTARTGTVSEKMILIMWGSGSESLNLKVVKGNAY